MDESDIVPKLEKLFPKLNWSEDTDIAEGSYYWATLGAYNFYAYLEKHMTRISVVSKSGTMYWSDNWNCKWFYKAKKIYEDRDLLRKAKDLRFFYDFLEKETQ